MELEKLQAEMVLAKQKAEDPEAVQQELYDALRNIVEEVSPTLGILRVKYGNNTCAERLDEPLIRARRALWASEYVR